MRPYVKKVKSNVKGGVEVELGFKTLVIGPNGSGKSAIVNATELALTGKASDISGRELVAREADLLALAPSREGELFSEATLSDGSISRWHISGAHGKATKAKLEQSPSVQIDRCVPLRSVMSAVQGSPETARKFFLAYATGVTTDADIRSLIPVDLHALLNSAVASCDAFAAPADKLLFGLETAKKRMRECAAQKKTLQATVDLQGQGLRESATDDEVAQAETDLERAFTLVKRADEEALIQIQAQDANERIQLLKNELVQIEAKLAQPAPQPITIPEAMFSLKESLYFQIENNVPECLMCGGKEHVSNCKNRYALLERKLQTAYEAKAAIELRDSLLMAKTRLLFDIAKLEGKRVTKSEKVGISVTEAREQLHQANNRVLELKTRRNAWEQMQRTREAIANASTQAVGWEQLATACEETVAKLLDSGVQVFGSKVQEFLPPTDMFGLRLREGEREVCQFGLFRDGILHTALSGAEWARVITAIACVCAPTDSLSLIVPEERAFDSKTLTAVLEALGRSNSQVILTTPNAPEIIPEGWLVIDTAKSEHRKKVAVKKESRQETKKDVTQEKSALTDPLLKGLFN